MTKLEDWYYDTQHVYHCPYCGAEAYSLTPSKQVCLKCKRVFARPEFLGGIDQ